jgi:hypothetical protein
MFKIKTELGEVYFMNHAIPSYYLNETTVKRMSNDNTKLLMQVQIVSTLCIPIDVRISMTQNLRLLAFKQSKSRTSDYLLLCMAPGTVDPAA